MNIFQEHLLNQLSTLPSDIDTLCKEGQHLTAFKLLKTIENSLCLVLPEESSVVEFINSVILKRCLPSLIHVVASAKHIDMTILYNLLLACGKDYLKYIQHYLKMYRRQPSKLHDLSVLGMELLDFHKESQSRDVMLNAVLTCKWWKKLKMVQNKIQYETFFKVGVVARLMQLITLDLMDVAMLQEYCVDFKIDPDIYYKEYLKR